MTTGAIASPTLPRGLRYRPALDGLRALAVYLVVAFHTGLPGFAGGYIGVDVFFVLSGYLVTKLLLRDLGLSRRVGLVRFYSRRFRRLLPAAFVTLIVTAVVYSAVASPLQAIDVIGGFRAAFLYVANWYFIGQSNNYFATNVNTNPVLHFWSLAVEEQFYFAWPLLLAAMAALASRAGRHKWNVVRVVVVIGIAASVISAFRISHVDLSRAYYGTGTRAYELLAGAALALTPQLVRALRAQGPRMAGGIAIASLVALILLGSSASSVGPIARGCMTVVATSALILAVEAHGKRAAARLLSSGPATALGRVSYGTYLWHWPFIVILTLRFDPPGVVMFALTCVVATGLAALSFRLIERPVRESRWLDAHRGRVITTGLAISVISGLVIAPAILRHSPLSSTASAVSQSDIESAKSARYGAVNCFRKPVSECIAVRGGGQRILLIGDSHALALIPAFSRVARDRGLTLAVAMLPNCPWPRGIVTNPLIQHASLASSCHAHQADWYDRVVPQFDPDVVAFVHLPLDDPLFSQGVRDAQGHALVPRDPDFAPTMHAAAAETIDAVKKPGRKIVIIEPIPMPPVGFDPLGCLSSASHAADCRFTASAGPTPLEQYYRTLADGAHVWSIDIDRLVCPAFPVCDEVVGGTVVRRDPQHITPAYSAQIGPELEALLVRQHIIS